MSRFGIDIGGTTVKIGLISDRGEILEKQVFPTHPDRPISRIAGDIVRVISEMNDGNISHIGIGAPELVNFSGDMDILSWDEELSKHFPKAKISIHNDGICAAWAEYVYGAGRGFNNIVRLTLGTGVGGGIIIDGKLFDKPCELGHIIVENNGRQCACGQKGCLETYASAKTYNKSESKDSFNKYMSQAIISLTNILGIEIFVIGGGLANAGEELIIPIRKLVSENIGKCVAAPQVLLSECKDAGIIGAAIL